MPILERTCTVQMAVDQAETYWNEFVAQQQQAGGQPDAAPLSGDGPQPNPGTVYFQETGNGRTQVTMQLDPEGIAEGDENTLNERVDGYLNRFKQFAESR